MITATCTWGDGPDVLLDLKEDHFILYEAVKHHKPPRGDYEHGFVTKGSMDLTATEALKLGNELITVARQAENLERVATRATLEDRSWDSITNPEDCFSWDDTIINSEDYFSWDDIINHENYL